MVDKDLIGGFGDIDDEAARAYIHIHYQQRTVRKGTTLIQGIPKDIDLKKLIKAFKKEFNCNGSIQKSKDKGKIIQLTGDQRKDVKDFLIQEGIGEADTIKIHGH